MRLSLLYSFILLFLFVPGVVAQKFIEKPYSEWKKGDAQTLISESGWAKQYSSNVVAGGADSQNIARAQRDSVNRGGGNPGSVAQRGGNLPIVIRLHSSPLVRQATVRLQQFAVGYDKMDASEKAKFDQSRKTFLDCAICKDYYVVTITKYTDASGEGTIADGIFQSLTLDDVKDHITLSNDKGESRKLVQFNPPKSGGDSAVFFFKRTDDAGKPLIDESTKNLEFAFTNTFMQWDKRNMGLYPRKFEFAVSKMLVDGKVSF